MLLSELLAGLTEHNVPVLSVSSVVSDSREACEGSVFVALAGYGAEHGLSYAEQAIKCGAAAVLWEPTQKVSVAPEFEGCVVLEVADLQHKLGTIAARFYDHASRDLAVVGITGTDGKTSCAWMLLRAWQLLKQQAAMIGTLGKGSVGALQRGAFTTPFPLELQSDLAGFKRDGVSHVAVEVSSHALHQARVAAVEFDVAVLTNLGRDHLDYHGNVQQYAAAKKRLFTEYNPRVAVLNIDDAFGAELANDALAAEVFSYGQGPATVQATDVDVSGGLSFVLNYQGQSHAIKTQLLGRFNVHNALAVAATLLAQGFDVADVVSVLAQIKAPPGRLEVFSNEQQHVVVDYAHTADALSAALSSMREVTAGSLSCVFGCGGDRDTGKRALMAQAAEQNADAVWVTDDNPRTESPAAIFADIETGFTGSKDVIWNHSRQGAIADAVSQLAANDWLLVAGKGHEDYQLIGQERLHFSDRECVAELLGLEKPEALYA